MSDKTDEVPTWLADERAAAAASGTAEPVPAASAVDPTPVPDPSAVDPTPVPDPSAVDPTPVPDASAVDPTPVPLAAVDPDVESAPVDLDSGAAPAADGAQVKKASIADVEEAMKDVVDPELGINVVDLGLVYGAFVDDDNIATLDMTLTSAACPLTDVLEEQTRAALTTGPGGGLVADFRINWVWLPPWGPDKITDDGREQLRALGFNV
jgi:metal-sulfur cluster biosynthetic enzyme